MLRSLPWSMPPIVTVPVLRRSGLTLATACVIAALPLMGAAQSAPKPATPPASAAAATIFGGLKADIKAPVEVAADGLSVNQTDGSATFTGNVLISQGEMKLKANEVTVVYAAGGQQKISSLKATGGVTLVNGPDAAEATDASYDVANGTVTLTGDVMLTQGPNVLSGQRMVVDLEDGTARVEGRVRSVLQPGGN